MADTYLETGKYVTRYYTITPEGQETCGKLLEEWKETKEIMDKLLETEEWK